MTVILYGQAMRYKLNHKEQTHQKIVKAASEEFRAHGVESVGIAKLMGILGLTHGGFYAHFADKEALVAESLVLALDQSLATMLAALGQGGWPAVFDYYLSEAHRDHMSLGCPLPALTAEIARRSPASREAFTQKLVEAYTAVAEYIPGQTAAQKWEKISVMLSSLVGAISLARAVSDPVLSQTILRSTQEQLLRFLEES